MKPMKTDPMKRFLKQHPFLVEAERIHRLVDEAVGTPEPIRLPERAVAKTLAEKLPILQQETYKSRMVRADDRRARTRRTEESGRMESRS